MIAGLDILHGGFLITGRLKILFLAGLKRNWSITVHVSLSVNKTSIDTSFVYLSVCMPSLDVKCWKTPTPLEMCVTM